MITLNNEVMIIIDLFRPDQSRRKCVSVAVELRAEQGPREPIKDYIREIREQYCNICVQAIII